jgi:hypothetical protein
MNNLNNNNYESDALSEQQAPRSQVEVPRSADTQGAPQICQVIDQDTAVCTHGAHVYDAQFQEGGDERE